MHTVIVRATPAIPPSVVVLIPTVVGYRGMRGAEYHHKTVLFRNVPCALPNTLFSLTQRCTALIGILRYLLVIGHRGVK